MMPLRHNMNLRLRPPTTRRDYHLRITSIHLSRGHHQKLLIDRHVTLTRTTRTLSTFHAAASTPHLNGRSAYRQAQHVGPRLSPGSQCLLRSRRLPPTSDSPSFACERGGSVTLA